MFRSLVLPLAAFSILACIIETQAQRRNVNPLDSATAIEVKNDRFSGKRTVHMLPVKLTANLEMSFVGEVNLARKPDYMEQDLGVSITVEFTTPYRGGVKFNDEMEFGFLVDGKRTILRTPPAKMIIDPYADRDKEPQKAVSVIMQSTLERIAAGHKVEMELGDTEVILNDQVLKTIRAFVTALQR